MKAKHVFLTMGLALTMGASVAAAGIISQVKDIKAVRAESTVYCKCTQSWWTVDGAAIGVHYWGGASAGTSWPGVRMSPVANETGIWSYSVPSDITGIIFTRINNSGAVSDWGAKTDDLTLPTDGKNMYTITSVTEMWAGEGKVADGEWGVYTPDVPAENGYYLVSSKSDFKYAGAVKMDADPTTFVDKDNCAELFGYTPTNGEKIKVRKYINTDAKPDEWSNYGGSAIDGLGAADGDANFEFTFTGEKTVDVFAKWVETSNNVWELKFYVAEHKDKLSATIYNVTFEGKTFVKSELGSTQYFVKGNSFAPAEVSLSGYKFRGFFTNIDCAAEHAYTAAVQNSSLILYAKFTRLGYYVTGDATYTGSESTAWKVDGAVMLNDEPSNPANIIDGTVTIPDSAETVAVKVKALYYDGVTGAEGFRGVSYTMPSDYDFVSLDENSNFVFTKGGTFSVYVNSSSEVYFTEGLDAFCTKFLSETHNVCSDILGGTKDKTYLAAIWGGFETAYNSLVDKTPFTSKTIDDGNEKGTNVEQVIARYSYIVKKYGTTLLNDFIWHETYSAQNQHSILALNNQTGLLIVVISATAAIASVAVTLYVIKRKKAVK